MQSKEVKKRYNKDVKNKFKGDYEYNRWFKDKILISGYEMTRKTIEDRLPVSENINDVLELGPGAGTWTKKLAQKYNQATFDLVDISTEMLLLAKSNVGSGNINFFESDFLEFNSNKKYDLFFSSRVIEYFDDKNDLIKKIFSFLKNGGESFIITKMPQYWRYKMFFKLIPEMHKKQIKPKDLVSIIKNNGGSNISVYPVVMTFPILKSVIVNKIIFETFRRFRLNFISSLLCESYCVKFSKK